MSRITLFLFLQVVSSESTTATKLKTLTRSWLPMTATSIGNTALDECYVTCSLLNIVASARYMWRPIRMTLEGHHNPISCLLNHLVSQGGAAVISSFLRGLGEEDPRAEPITSGEITNRLVNSVVVTITPTFLRGYNVLSSRRSHLGTVCELQGEGLSDVFSIAVFVQSRSCSWLVTGCYLCVSEGL